MPGSGKDRLAALVVDQHGAFEEALAGSRQRYPTREFRSFAAAIRQYVDATREDEMLHRGVVRAVNGLVEYLRSERKRVPDEVLLEAERLECLLFLGYDPHFDDEPPGLWFGLPTLRQAYRFHRWHEADFPARVRRVLRIVQRNAGNIGSSAESKRYAVAGNRPLPL